MKAHTYFGGWLGIILGSLWINAAEKSLLWEIGQPDNNNAEFFLAPNRYSELRDDALWAVGKSSAKTDWPYLQPGPHDAWAGGRQHTFTILFGLKETPSPGECVLRLDFLDTHGRSAPKLRVAINGRNFDHQTPNGAGDASIFGEPAKGKEHLWNLAFPASLLKQGPNEITITTLTGSWVLYDWIGFEAPSGCELAEVSGTIAGQAQSPPVLVERQGELAQIVQVTLRHLGEAKSAVLQVAGGAPEPIQLKPGTQTAQVAVPKVAAMTNLALTVAVDGKNISTQSVAINPVRPWVIYLLPHSHVDIGYTHVQTDVERAQWRYLEMAMEAARKSAHYPAGSRFKWNVEVLWAVDSYLKQAAPEKRQAFVEAVKAGQVGLQALYGNELTGLCQPEELLRLMSCAQRVSRICDTPITSAMITDVPGYTWGVVPAFAHNGVKYFSVGPNGGDRIGHTAAAWGDKPFWWIGPNGRDKVLVWMTGTGYYQVFRSPEKLQDYLRQLEDKGYPYDYVQVRHCLGDNGAPDLNFADRVKAWNDQYAYPKLVIATTDDMFRDFEKRYGDQIPTASGDFTPYWEDGAASSALETALNRASANRLVQAETLFAMLNPKSYPADDFYQAWRNVILYDEHTWGAHNSISQPDHPFVKSQWAIKRQFAVDADAQSRRLLAAANESRGPAPQLPAGMQAVDVFNTTSGGYAYTLITIPKELSVAGDGVATSPTNKPIYRVQRLTTGELVLRPCWGAYRTERLYITSNAPPEPSEYSGAAVTNNILTVKRSAVASDLEVRLDEASGAIASLRYGGRELVNTNSPTRLNDYFYLPGSDVKKVQRNGPVKISVKERGPLVASLLVESDAPGCRKLTREVRVHALRSYVEIINTVDKAPVRAKEGVHFGFGFHVPDGVIRMDVPWASVRPEADQLPGACKNWFTVQRYVDISSKELGVTLITPDAPLIEVGGLTANLIGSLSNPKSWRDKVEASQDLYSWAMNNHWHTNYRAEQEGPTVFRYFIIPHTGDHEAQVAQRAMEIVQPLVVLPARGEEPVHRPALLASPAAQVTAWKPSEDGQADIIRLFNTTSLPQKLPLNWSGSTNRTVWLSDASEKPLQKAEETVELPPRSLLTLRAEIP